MSEGFDIKDQEAMRARIEVLEAEKINLMESTFLRKMAGLNRQTSELRQGAWWMELALVPVPPIPTEAEEFMKGDDEAAFYRIGSSEIYCDCPVGECLGTEPVARCAFRGVMMRTSFERIKTLEAENAELKRKIDHLMYEHGPHFPIT